LDPAFNYGGLRGMRSDGKAIEAPVTDQFAVEMDDFALHPGKEADTGPRRGRPA
jgi:hypothetical protein